MSLNIEISLNDFYELKNISEKVYYPLKKLVDKKNFLNILKNYRLTSGEIFPLPIFLDVEKKIAKELKLKKIYNLVLNNKIVGKIKVEDIYKINKEFACKKIFKSNNKNHPGVKNFLDKKEYFIGGEIKLKRKKLRNEKYPFLNPIISKKLFRKKKWKKIIGFQTRNIPHRAHEQLLRTALEFADGLFVQPLVGNKKKWDFSNDAIFKSYKYLINKFFPKNKIYLGPLYTSMWYAGPREAIFHAIVRRNYGCTHFIVGRDHAGVGNFYAKYESQQIFDNFNDELNIKILKFAGPFYCKLCDGVLTEKSCPHINSNKYPITHISGTDVRKKLINNFYLSKKLVRPEIINILKNIKKLFI